MIPKEDGGPTKAATNPNATFTPDSSADQRRSALQSEAIAMRWFPGSILNATDIGTYAVELATRHWKVFPLRGKAPAVRNPHPEGSPERRHCRGECGQLGHGIYDATDDVDTIIDWWSGRFRGFNIGARIPEPILLIDIDPRHGGDKSWAALEVKYGAFPDCMMQFSGRGDGGCHRFVIRPAGQLDAKRLGPGIDFKTSTGYAVMAPSIHPDSGKPYTRVDGVVATPPDWFVNLVTKPQQPPAPPRPPRRKTLMEEYFGSPADQYSTSTSWADILEPHGWRCLDADPDADGARWLHPTHTSACSATVRYGCLFVWSTSTVFDISEPNQPNGITRFKAYAILNHGGDMSAATRAILKGVA